MPFWAAYGPGKSVHQHGKRAYPALSHLVEGNSAAGTAEGVGKHLAKRRGVDSGLSSQEDLNRWTQAWAELFVRCKEDNPNASDADCACDDNSDPIPCDGKVHIRTFGPVTPSWQRPETFERFKPTEAGSKSPSSGK